MITLLKLIRYFCQEHSGVDNLLLYTDLTRYPEEKDGNGRTLYGGVRDGNIVGGTKVSFDSILISSLVLHLNSGVSWSRFQEHSHRNSQHRCPREGGGSRGDIIIINTI